MSAIMLFDSCALCASVQVLQPNVDLMQQHGQRSVVFNELVRQQQSILDREHEAIRTIPYLLFTTEVSDCSVDCQANFISGTLSMGSGLSELESEAHCWSVHALASQAAFAVMDG